MHTLQRSRVKPALVNMSFERTCIPLCAVKTCMQIKYACKKLEAYCAFGSSFKVAAGHTQAQLNRGWVFCVVINYSTGEKFEFACIPEINFINLVGFFRQWFLQQWK